jgi:hypothetical protein
VRASKKDERGSTMLESALTLLAVVFILIGMLDVGQLLFVHQTLTERVRKATSYAARSYDPDAIRNIVLYGATTPADGQHPAFELTSSMVTVERQDAGTAADRVIVRISGYPLRFYTPGFQTLATALPITMVAPYEAGT